MRHTLIPRFALLVIFSLPALAQWQPQQSHTQESLRGVSVVDQNVVWASGTHGTYLLTTDGGATWVAAQVPGAEALDFRDVESFGSTAYLLAAGPGEQSRIYKTRDRGAHWELQFTNHDPKGFLDCMAFWDEQHGIAVGDPVGGRFQLLRTSDGGKRWEPVAQAPAALDGEALFAASGTCIATQGTNKVWFATGGAAARVFRSSDRGKKWEVAETPMAHGSASAGIFSIAFRDPRHGVIAGGDYKQPEQGGANLATTDDGGRTWKLATAAPQKYFSGAAYVSQGGGAAVVGSSVAAFSEDDLKSWKSVAPAGFNAIGSRPSLGVAWAVGPKGTIAKGEFGSTGVACEAPAGRLGAKQLYFSEEERPQQALPLPPDVLKLLLRNEEVKGAMERANDTQRRNLAKLFRAAEVDLGPANDVDLIVAGTFPLSGADNDWYWVVRSACTSPELVLFVGTNTLEVMRSRTNGYRDIRTVWSSASQTATRIYKFDGKKYKLWKEKWTENQYPKARH